MTDRWYYRLFGEDLGPVTFEQLKQLVQNRTLWDVDEVRRGDTENWVYVSSLSWTTSGAGHDAQEAASTDTSSEKSTGQSNNSSWYCLIGETEFGPWTFDELALFAQSRQMTADDEVKFGEDGKWRKVGSIGRLMALLPYDATEESLAEQGQEEVADATELPTIAEPDELFPIHSPVSELLAPKTSKADSAPDDEANQPDDAPTPLSDEMELLEMLFPASNEETQKQPLAAEEEDAEDEEEDIKEEEYYDEPAEEPVPQSNRSKTVAAPPEPNPQDMYAQAKALIAQTMLAQAEAAYRASEEQAKTHIAWVNGPEVDPYWYGWAGGVEFGPVEFSQVLGLAKSGQLKSTDFVRNGQHAQFCPASNVPGLFTAVGLMNKAAETLSLAKAQVMTVTAMADEN